MYYILCIFYKETAKSTARKCLPISCTTIHNLQKTPTRTLTHTHIAAVNYRMPNRKVYSHLGTIYFEREPMRKKKQPTTVHSQAQKLYRSRKKRLSWRYVQRIKSQRVGLSSETNRQSDDQKTSTWPSWPRNTDPSFVEHLDSKVSGRCVKTPCANLPNPLLT